MKKVRMFGPSAIAAVLLTLGGCVGQALQYGAAKLQEANVASFLQQGDQRMLTQRHGTLIDPARVAEIKHGVTTRADVEKLFGPPQYVSMVGDGKRMMIYSGGTVVEQRTLQVNLDKNNVVEDHEFNIRVNEQMRRMAENAGIAPAPSDEKK